MDDPVELSPIEVVILESLLEPFCQISTNGGEYHQDICSLHGCHVCADLLLKEAA